MTDDNEDTIVKLIKNESLIREPILDSSHQSIKFTNALLSIYQGPFERIRNELTDLTAKQSLCITQMQLETKKMCDVQEDIELNDLFSSMEIYQKKLLHIKKEILAIHKKTFKLKKRALQFQQSKQNNAV